MNRVVAGGLGLLAGAALLVGCSNDKTASTANAGDTQVSSGGSTEVKVDGKDLAGLDLNSVTCVKQGGKINVASGAIGGQQGLGIVMTDADDTFDSDVAELLAPHTAALNALVREGDPRVVQLVRKAGELTEDVGIVVAEAGVVTPRRDDYALAAGTDRGAQTAGAIATGTGSLAWAAVPPAVFDAAESAIGWQIEASGPETYAVVGVDLLGSASPRGIGVRLTSGFFTGVGELDSRGRARFPVVDAEGQPVAEAAAWNHDWKPTTVTVGAPVDESELTRQRVRDFARARLRTPAGDAFLAEILAADSDY